MKPGNVMLKKDILRRKDDFTAIYKKGRSVGETICCAFLQKERVLSYNRTAFLASKKVGNSVERNRARRLMKENYRIWKGEIKEGYDHDFYRPQHDQRPEGVRRWKIHEACFSIKRKCISERGDSL